MLDPITVFLACYILNVNLPAGRLSVQDVIKAKEQVIINNTISQTSIVRK